MQRITVCDWMFLWFWMHSTRKCERDKYCLRSICCWVLIFFSCSIRCTQNHLQMEPASTSAASKNVPGNTEVDKKGGCWPCGCDNRGMPCIRQSWRCTNWSTCKHHTDHLQWSCWCWLSGKNTLWVTGLLLCCINKAVLCSFSEFSVFIITDYVSTGGNAMAFIHLIICPSVCLSVCFHCIFGTDWLLTLKVKVKVMGQASAVGSTNAVGKASIEGCFF